MRKKSQKSKVKSQNFLNEVVEKKNRDLRGQKRNYSLFKRAIKQGSKQSVAVIAELKFASPTNPHLGSAKDLLLRAVSYEKAGVDAISVITEKHFFKGDIGFVSRVKKVVKLPILQKDFIIDEYQIYEAKIAGADALLLIARLVNAKTLKRFVKLCFAESIEPVVEVFDEKDLEKAVATETRIIAVNARDLDTFVIDVAKACKLMEKIPNRFIKLGFSGIQSKVEVRQYINDGAKGVLVGTSLMQATNVKKIIHDLRM